MSRPNILLSKNEEAAIARAIKNRKALVEDHETITDIQYALTRALPTFVWAVWFGPRRKDIPEEGTTPYGLHVAFWRSDPLASAGVRGRTISQVLFYNTEVDT